MTALQTPLVCVVSDGERLAAEYGWPDRETAVLAHAEQAAAGRADLFLVREPTLSGRALERLVASIGRATARSTMRVIVNDRLDVALAAGAAGVHLKASSFGANRVRDIAPASFLVGRSVHAEDEAVTVAALGGVDYLLFGTVFDSASKPAGHTVAGVDLYARVMRRLQPLPVVAIGGVDASTIGRLAGAPGVAAIQWFRPDIQASGRLAANIAHARAALVGATRS